ncbi:MAG TPA: class I SAM-dependent methyltransferase [Blastocatellia bacterium]|nr:class I SAM-dependent methyltransferase [Blastocatellia bacterium]
MQGVSALIQGLMAKQSEKTPRIIIATLMVAAIAWSASAQLTKEEKAGERDRWNRIYADPKSDFSHATSQLLIDAVSGRKPGTAIDLGMGEGRNAVFLARQGWQVTGVDLSDVAVDQATKHAADAGARIQGVVADLDEYDLGHEKWDLITLFYMHAWQHLSKLNNTERLKNALKPGGLLVIEGFGGGDVGYQTNELLRAFDGLRVLRYEDSAGEAAWAPGQKSRIIRFIAQKSK